MGSQRLSFRRVDPYPLELVMSPPSYEAKFGAPRITSAMAPGLDIRALISVVGLGESKGDILNL